MEGAIRLTPKEGLAGYFKLGDTISKVLSSVESNNELFGRIILDHNSTGHPLALVLPDACTLSLLNHF